MTKFEIDFDCYFVPESEILYQLFGDEKVTIEKKERALEWFDFGEMNFKERTYRGFSCIYSCDAKFLEYLYDNLDSKKGYGRPWVFFKDDFKKLSEVINNFKNK